MITITLTFDHNINESLQVRDDVYYCPNEPLGGFRTVDNENLPNTGIVHIGKCTNIDRDQNEVEVTVAALPPQDAIVANGLILGCFIMFSKSNQANLSSLLGYYAETTFINDSPKEAELFAASTEFSESSK